MSDQPDTYAVGSMPVGHMDASPVPGSRVGECEKCKVAVWVSPSSEEPLKKGYRLLCMDCCLKEISELPADDKRVVLENMSPTHAQIKEIMAAMRGPG